MAPLSQLLLSFIFAAGGPSPTATCDTCSSSQPPAGLSALTGGVKGALPPTVVPNPRSGNMSLIAALELAPTQQMRVNLLDQPGDYVFDFNHPPDASVVRGKGGHTVAATAETFPAVIGNGVSMTVGFLSGCGLNTPHVHNRATEFNIVVQGRLVTSFQVENGVREREHVLGRFQATVFPQGAIHSEFNPDCDDAVFVAGFNNVDPGVEQVAQTFFNLRPDMVGAALGGLTQINGEDIESFRELLPANVAAGVETCLARCGKQKKAKRDLNALIAEYKA